MFGIDGWGSLSTFLIFLSLTGMIVPRVEAYVPCLGSGAKTTSKDGEGTDASYNASQATAQKPNLNTTQPRLTDRFAHPLNNTHRPPPILALPLPSPHSQNLTPQLPRLHSLAMFNHTLTIANPAGRRKDQRLANFQVQNSVEQVSFFRLRFLPVIAFMAGDGCRSAEMP